MTKMPLLQIRKSRGLVSFFLLIKRPSKDKDLRANGISMLGKNELKMYTNYNSIINIKLIF